MEEPPSSIVTPEVRIKLQQWLDAVAASTKKAAALEVEARLVDPKDPLTRDKFTKCLKGLIKSGWKLDSRPEALDISTRNGVRTTIETPSEIARFCNGGLAGVVDATKVAVIQKARVDQAVDVASLGVRFNAKSETPVQGDALRSHLASLKDLTKSYRFKKRFSLTHDRHAAVRVDFTIVKSSDAPQKLQHVSPSYEVEVEALPGKAASADAFLAAVKEVLVVLSGGFQFLSQATVDAVLQDYLNRTFGASLSAAREAPKQHFAGPNLVTLMVANLTTRSSTSSSATPSILGDTAYTVTDKADGERGLLFIHQGAAYLINNRLSVVGLGVSVAPSLSGSLLDGEWIDLPDGRHKFLAFDMYLDSGGTDVRKLPLLAPDKADSRLKRLRLAVDALARKAPAHLEVSCKTFLEGEGEALLLACGRVLQGHKAGNHAYQIDGLIFTPRDMAVGAEAPGGPHGTWGGTWPWLFKWKSPQFNSIDFLVTFPKDQRVVKDDVLYRVAHLSVGYNTATDPLTAINVLGGVPGGGPRGGKYVARPFQPNEDPDGPRLYEAYLPVHDTADPVCGNGDPIKNDTIVEFAYSGKLDVEPFSSFAWQPMRLRVDKTQEYAMTRRVSANNHTTANNVWQSIVDPISEDAITGAVPVDDLVTRSSAQSVYYAKIGQRDVSATKALRNFHSYWVKLHTLYAPLKRKGVTSLLELGCGKGGDLHKMCDTGFRDVVGLDLFADNISNPSDGAYARLRQQQRHLPPNARYAFVPYDVSQPIDAARINRMEDDGDRAVMQALWAIVPRQMVRPKGLWHYYGLAKPGFDVVSCQFAIHYFFKTMDMVDVFCQNVARNLRPGGTFIGTCMDGTRVADKLSRLPVGQELVGQQGDQLLWKLSKLYDDGAVAVEPGGGGGDGDAIIRPGNSIAVYLESIDTVNTEYLVDYRLLKARMAHAGLVEGAHGGFEGLFAEMQAHKATSDSEQRLVREALGMSDAERELSFMNMYFIFNKPAAAQ